MVFVVMSVEAAPGKGPEVREWLKRIGSYEKKTYGWEWQAMRAVTPAPGQSARYLMIGTFDSLAAWGDHMQKAEKDKEWQALVREAFVEKQYIAHNSFSRALYEVI